jgi:NAD(P)-dependent dehydrogenase (short-subunit alcohol dehydrogenase family)
LAQDARVEAFISEEDVSLALWREAVRWGKPGARVNTISPGIIITPLARDELTGPRGEGYRKMVELSPAGRAGTPDEVGVVGALLLVADGRSSPAATSSWTTASPPPITTVNLPTVISNAEADPRRGTTGSKG